MTPTAAERADKLEGLGCKRKRVEDIRFTQGKGNYVDDIKMPGMLLRRFRPLAPRPCAHQEDRHDQAKALPGVIAVLTADDLKPLNLHWMPTLAGDVQAVLADGKVLFQNQEVAFVIAEDRYIAADAAELVEVEYEALPASSTRSRPWRRTRRSCARTSRTRPTAPTASASTTTTSSRGRSATSDATDAAFAKAEVTIKELIVYQRVHPCPLETCQMRRLVRQDQGRADGLGHLPGAACHPHRGAR